MIAPFQSVVMLKTRIKEKLIQMMVTDQDVPKSDVESLVVPQSHLGPRRPNTHQSRHTKTTLSALSNTPKKKGLIYFDTSLWRISQVQVYSYAIQNLFAFPISFFALSRQSVGCNHCCKHNLKVFLARGVWIPNKENDIAENLATPANFLSYRDKICKYQRTSEKSYLSSYKQQFSCCQQGPKSAI